jgi:hypothetical protein
MTTTGPYQIQTNTGDQDRFLTASRELIERLRFISQTKLEKINEEYNYAENRVKTEFEQKKSSLISIEKRQELTQQRDSVLQKINKLRSDKLSDATEFLPTVADIESTHILYTAATYKPYVQLGMEYHKTQPSGNGKPTLGQRISFIVNTYGQMLNDCVVHIQLTGLAAINPLNKVRYAEFVGHKLFRKVSFKIGGIELDSYGPEKMNVEWQFKVPPGKETGYLRMVGQEIPYVGYLVADPQVDNVREYRYFGEGAQTMKSTQPTLDLWIPLLFWFRDIRNAFPNFLMPAGTVEFDIDLERENLLVGFADNVGAGGRIYNPPVISKCELYSNHVYMMPPLFEIYTNRFQFQLVRVNRIRKESLLTKSKDRIKPCILDSAQRSICSIANSGTATVRLKLRKSRKLW